MPTSPDRNRPTRKISALSLEILLWVFAVFALGTVGFHLIDARLYQQRAIAQLETTPTDPVERQDSWGLDPTPDSLPPDEQPGPETFARPISEGTPLGSIEIPRLGISAVVAEGEHSSTLRRAVGHLPYTALPGEGGNVALAAHRDTFFRGLGEIRSGDLVVLDSGARRHSYRVVWTDIVDPSEVAVTRPTPQSSLTLITCYPFRWIGPAPRRFVVRAHLEGEDAEAVAPQQVPATTLETEETAP